MPRQPPEQARAQQDASDYLADDGRLTAPACCGAEQGGDSDDNGNITDKISIQDIQIHASHPMRKTGMTKRGRLTPTIIT
jgi:hypothetical protein